LDGISIAEDLQPVSSNEEGVARKIVGDVVDVANQAAVEEADVVDQMELG
jgi:hypothetical protein